MFFIYGKWQNVPLMHWFAEGNSRHYVLIVAVKLDVQFVVIAQKTRVQYLSLDAIFVSVPDPADPLGSDHDQNLTAIVNSACRKPAQCRGDTTVFYNSMQLVEITEESGDLRVDWVTIELVWRAGLHQTAASHQQNSVRHSHCLNRVMSDEH